MMLHDVCQFKKYSFKRYHVVLCKPLSERHQHKMAAASAQKRYLRKGENHLLN